MRSQRREAGIRRRRPVVAAAVAATAVVAALVAGCSNETAPARGADAPLSGVVRTPAAQVGDASLPVATDPATSMNFRAEPGHLLVVYFGYTSCPDICPTTLADLKAAMRQLGGSARRIDVAMATIDPRRDTPTVIEGYLQSFIPDATALRTEDDAALRAVTDAFGANYVAEYPVNEEPRVAHSAFLYAVDPSGSVVVAWPFGSSAADMSADMRQLLGDL